MASGKTIKLNSGYDCPLLGYGTWQSTDTEKLKVGIKAAIEAGYRHIDTAHAYRNESVIGETLHELFTAGTVKREELFLVTKVFGTHFKPAVLIELLKKQLADLRVDYVDMYLLHAPVALAQPAEGQMMLMGADGKPALDLETKLEDTWQAMEKCVEMGLTRSIGISNFSIKQTERLLKQKIPPAMNQVESHPLFQNAKLTEFCQKNGVVVTGYSCFGSPGSVNQFTGKILIPVDILNDERIVKMATKYGKSTAQVILRWQIQRNVVVIPKSLTPARIAENYQVWDFELSGEDMKAMAAIDEDKRFSLFPAIQAHPEYPFPADFLGSC